MGLLSPLRFYQVPECSWRPLLPLITHPVTQHIPEHLLGGHPSGGAAGSRQSPPPVWRFPSSTPCSEPRGAPSLPTLWVLPSVTVGPGRESVPVCCGRGHGPSTPPPPCPWPRGSVPPNPADPAACLAWPGGPCLHTGFSSSPACQPPPSCPGWGEGEGRRLPQRACGSR